LRDQDINLTQLGNNLFSRMLLPSHDNILHMAQSHTSGRTTFQGAGQARVEQDRHTHHAFPSDQSKLDLPGVRGRRDDGDDTLLDEPDPGDGGIGRDQDLTHGKGTDVEVLS
ncbi:hypothetical protein, partial [Methylobacterium sp. J-090]|uniref:hypothetical protein n=1 Tax=Methylobacterium sp. J-090 TaxID=2836666 RepID=UPI001FBBE1E7